MSTEKTEGLMRKKLENPSAKNFAEMKTVLTELCKITEENSIQICEIKNVVNLLLELQTDLDKKTEKKLNDIKSDIADLKEYIDSVCNEQIEQLSRLYKTVDGLAKASDRMSNSIKSEKNIIGKTMAQVIESEQHFIENVVHLLEIHSVLDKTEFLHKELVSIQK